MIRVEVDLDVSLPQKFLQKCPKGLGGSPPTESVRNCWSCRDIIWSGTSHFQWGIGYVKLFARWVLWLLMQDQKRNRAEMSKECLARFQRTNKIFCAGLWPQIKHGSTTLGLLYGRLARWIKWRACDVGEAKEGLENLWCRWSNRRVGEWAVT